MKYVNYYVDYMVYLSLLGKSLFVAFGKSFLGFCKIFTPAIGSISSLDYTYLGGVGASQSDYMTYLSSQLNLH